MLKYVKTPRNTVFINHFAGSTSHLTHLHTHTLPHPKNSQACVATAALDGGRPKNFPLQVCAARCSS